MKKRNDQQRQPPRAKQAVGGEAEGQAANDTLMLRLDGELIELTPTVEYPIQILQTEFYETWINSVTDVTTNARITINVDKMRRGLMGDWKDVGSGVVEMRLNFGPGYRVYYGRYGKIVIVLLGGGEKNGQQKDIADAQRVWEKLKNEITQV